MLGYLYVHSIHGGLSATLWNLISVWFHAVSQPGDFSELSHHSSHYFTITWRVCHITSQVSTRHSLKHSHMTSRSVCLIIGIYYDSYTSSWWHFAVSGRIYEAEAFFSFYSKKGIETTFRFNVNNNNKNLWWFFLNVTCLSSKQLLKFQPGGIYQEWALMRKRRPYMMLYNLLVVLITIMDISKLCKKCNKFSWTNFTSEWHGGSVGAV